MVAVDHPEAVRMRGEMVAFQWERYGDLFAARPELTNGLDDDRLAASAAATALVMVGETAAGHGLLVDRGAGELQVKRVYVRPQHRRTGISRLLMQALEEHAVALGGRRVVLSTGPRQPEAAALYSSLGYRRRGPYGDPAWHDVALFFEKELDPEAG